MTDQSMGGGSTSIRQRRLATAKILASANGVDIHQWDDLLKFPDWCFLSNEEQIQFKNLCGALFIAPIMRLWIDGKRINLVRDLLGSDAFFLVINSEISAQYSSSLDDKEVIELLDRAGASVLVSEVDPVALSFVESKTVSNCEFIPRPIAKKIAFEAYGIIHKLR